MKPSLLGGSSHCHHLPGCGGQPGALPWLRPTSPCPAARRGGRAGFAAFARQPPAGFESDAVSLRAGQEGGYSRLQPLLPGGAGCTALKEATAG